MQKQNPPNMINLLVLRLVWGALILSQAMYFSIASVLKKNALGAPVVSEHSPLPYFLIALIALFLAYALPRILLKRALKKHALHQRAQELSENGEPASLETLLMIYFPAFIVRLAFLESVTITGFVLALAQHEVAQMIPFAAVSLIGFLLNFPTERKIRSRI